MLLTKALVAATALELGAAGPRSIARRRASAAVCFAVGLILAAPGAEANPKFARETGKACSFCHTGPPRLNDAGLAFKNNGFRFPNDKETPDKGQKDAPAQ